MSKLSFSIPNHKRIALGSAVFRQFGLHITRISVGRKAVAAVILLVFLGGCLQGPGETPQGIDFPPTETPQPSPTDTLSPTETPVPPSATIEPSATPSNTATASATPTETSTPTESPTPTAAQHVVSAKSQAFCRYGPSKAFLPNVDIFHGDRMVVDGRYEYGGWLWVKPDKVDRHCWIAASLVEPAVDLSKVFVVHYLVIMPYTKDIASPENVNATREGDKVRITWSPTVVKSEAFRGYLIDAFVCQDGAYIKFITYTDKTSISISDQKNTCGAPSWAILYGGTKWGYTDPVEIKWP